MTPSPTTAAPTAAPTRVAPGTLLINEIAWAGTLASANDEWIELHNPGPDPIDLTGWSLVDGNDIAIRLRGQVQPFGFFLLERTDDQTVANLPADQIYTGALRNDGEGLELLDPSGGRVDSANLDGGSWPAGERESRASMERIGGDDFPGNWQTSTGYGGTGLDAEGYFIPGTPRTVNSIFIPTATATQWIPTQTSSTPTPIPSDSTAPPTGSAPSASPSTTPSLITPTFSGTTTTIPITGTASPSATRTPSLTATPAPSSTTSPSPSASPSPSGTSPPSPAVPTSPPPQFILINEVAWAGTSASASDEWIELHNPNPFPVALDHWRLTDDQDLNAHLAGTIEGHGYYLLERTDDRAILDLPAHQIYTGSLRNSGESLTLLDPAGRMIDSANLDGGPWPAGEAGSHRSMERRGGEDRPGNWSSFSGYGGAGIDADGSPIQGTPGQMNSIHVDTPTPTSTQSATPSLTPTRGFGFSPQSLLINEVAWAGTLASSSDEWIELYNPGPGSINLAGWVLTDGGDLRVQLSGNIPAGSFFLLERTDDQTVSNVAAGQLYTGSLRDSGERLSLWGPGGELVDSANGDGGRWPGGSARRHSSMERRGGEDRSGNWGTFTGYHGNGLDADGSPIRGTPGQVNSLFFPTPTPSSIPNRLLINEVLIRPHYDWMGDGSYSTADEFIEIYNPGPYTLSLNGWVLDDVLNKGSKPYELPNNRIEPGEFLPIFRRVSRIALNDTGDVVRLMAPDGGVVDQIQYLKVRAYNLSYGRLPDGADTLVYGLWPTPGRANLLFVEPSPTPTPDPLYLAICPEGGVPTERIFRLSRRPEWIAWLGELGWTLCR